jgi:hypothetical protein
MIHLKVSVCISHISLLDEIITQTSELTRISWFSLVRMSVGESQAHDECARSLGKFPHYPFITIKFRVDTVWPIHQPYNYKNSLLNICPIYPNLVRHGNCHILVNQLSTYLLQQLCKCEENLGREYIPSNRVPVHIQVQLTWANKPKIIF